MGSVGCWKCSLSMNLALTLTRLDKIPYFIHHKFQLRFRSDYVHFIDKLFVKLVGFLSCVFERLSLRCFCAGRNAWSHTESCWRLITFSVALGTEPGVLLGRRQKLGLEKWKYINTSCTRKYIQLSRASFGMVRCRKLALNFCRRKSQILSVIGENTVRRFGWARKICSNVHFGLQNDVGVIYIPASWGLVRC